jgi:hypothetical protein
MFNLLSIWFLLWIAAFAIGAMTAIYYLADRQGQRLGMLPALIATVFTAPAVLTVGYLLLNYLEESPHQCLSTWF